MQIFTGHARTTPLALMLKDIVPINMPLGFVKAQKLMDIEKLSKTMTEIYAQVAEKVTHDRKADIQKYNDKTHVRAPDLRAGDYALVAENRKSETSKMQLKWKCPRRVASVESDYVFIVENLVAYTTRLRFYRGDKLKVTAELVQAAEHNDHALLVVSIILGARYNKQEMFHGFLVVLNGFPVGEAA
jgi:hypothetical protein